MALSARTAGSRTRLIHRLSSKMLLLVVKGEWVMSAFDVIVLVHVDSDSPQMPGQVLLRNLRSHRANNHFILFLSFGPFRNRVNCKEINPDVHQHAIGLKGESPCSGSQAFHCSQGKWPPDILTYSSLHNQLWRNRGRLCALSIPSKVI